MQTKFEFNWRLKRLLRFSFPVIKRRVKTITPVLKKLSKEASDRYGYLSLRYNTHTWFRVCSRKEFRESLYVLDLLDRYLPRRPSFGSCLDIGAKKWSYLPGLAAYTGSAAWSGVEIDAHQRYIDLSTRRAHAEYMIRAYPGCHYLPISLLDFHQEQQFITWFLPYVSHPAFETSELPERYFQPKDLLAHAWELLRPGGLMFIVNQGEDEAEIQQQLFNELGIEAEALGTLESEFSPYDKPRIGWLLQKPSS